MKTLRDLAVQALEVQNASNPLGLAHGFHEATKHLRDTGVNSTADLCGHPIYRLWVMKLADLGGVFIEPTEFATAYDQTSAIAYDQTSDAPGTSDELAERLAAGDSCTDALATDSWLAGQLVPDRKYDRHEYDDFDHSDFLDGLEAEQSEPIYGKCWPQ